MSVRISPLKMTAEECRRQLEAEKRSRNCLPQDIEYWQFYIDFHTHGQAYAESKQRGSAPDHFPANDQIRYPKITIADFDLDIPHSPAMASVRLSVTASSEPRGMEDAGGDSMERHAPNSHSSWSRVPAPDAPEVYPSSRASGAPL